MFWVGSRGPLSTALSSSSSTSQVMPGSPLDDCWRYNNLCSYKRGGNAYFGQFIANLESFAKGKIMLASYNRAQTPRLRDVANISDVRKHFLERYQMHTSQRHSHLLPRFLSYRHKLRHPKPHSSLTFLSSSCMVLLDLCRSSRIVETGLPKSIEHFTRSDHEIRLHVGQMA